MASLRLTLSIRMSTCLVFFQKCKRPATPLCIYGSNTSCADAVNFLGFTLRRKLFSTSHIKMVVKHCSHLTNVLKSICGISWGSDPLRAIKLHSLLLDVSDKDLLRFWKVQWLYTHIVSLEQMAIIMPLAESFPLNAKYYLLQTIWLYLHSVNS